MATNIFLGMPPPKIKEWIIAEAERKQQEMLKTPLHFVAEEPNATMSFKTGRRTYETSPTGEEGSWTPYTSNTTITLANVGDKVYFRAGSDEGNETCQGSQFYIGKDNFKGKIAAKGNIQSLLDRKMERMDAPVYCYNEMFSNCTSLTQAPLLPATSVENNCYCEMFYNCTSLTKAPLLPATSFCEYCYAYMFSGCTSLPEPKYNMSHMTFDEVAFAVRGDCIFGRYEGDISQVQCSDKILVAKLVEIDEEYDWVISVVN